MGAREVTHGHEALAAAWLTEAWLRAAEAWLVAAEAWLAEAWLVAAVAGTASSPASAAAAKSRPLLYLWRFDES
jgi:hypothetical protein